MKRADRLWNNFLESLNNTKIETKEEFYDFICQWIQNNRNRLDDDILNKYNFDRYLELDIADYAIELSDINIEEELRVLNDWEPTAIEILLMELNEYLRNLITFKIEKECPMCEEYVFNTYYHEEEDKVILQCDTCPYSMYLNGEKYKGEKILVIANLSILKKFNLIKD